MPARLGSHESSWRSERLRRIHTFVSKPALGGGQVGADQSSHSLRNLRWQQRSPMSIRGPKPVSPRARTGCAKSRFCSTLVLAEMEKMSLEYSFHSVFRRADHVSHLRDMQLGEPSASPERASFRSWRQPPLHPPSFATGSSSRQGTSLISLQLVARLRRGRRDLGRTSLDFWALGSARGPGGSHFEVVF